MGSRISRIAAATAAAGVAMLWTTAALACGSGGYSYAGIQSRHRSVRDRRAAHPASRCPPPPSHPDTSPAGSASAAPAKGRKDRTSGSRSGSPHFPTLSARELYYELTLPGSKPTYHQLAPEWPFDKPVRIALLEMRARPNHWRVWVNGGAVTAPIALPASHGRFRPMATAESHDVGTATCNTFLYRFHHVTIARAPGGGWRPLNRGYPISDPATRLRQDDRGAFLAAEGETAFGLMRTLIP